MKVRVELGDLSVEIDGEKGDITAAIVSEIVKPFMDTEKTEAIGTQRVGFDLEDEDE